MPPDNVTAAFDWNDYYQDKRSAGKHVFDITQFVSRVGCNLLSTNQSINQSVNQPTNQPTNQSINQ